MGGLETYLLRFLLSSVLILDCFVPSLWENKNVFFAQFLEREKYGDDCAESWLSKPTECGLGLPPSQLLLRLPKSVVSLAKLAVLPAEALPESSVLLALFTEVEDKQSTVGVNLGTAES